MLRNSGPYGPNDMPMSSETSVDVPQTSQDVNITHNIKNVSKIPQQTMGYAMNQFVIPEPPQYNYSQHNSSSNFGEYPNLNPMNLHPAFYTSMSQHSPFSPWSNGIRALDFDVQNQLNRFNEIPNYNLNDTTKNSSSSKNINIASDSNERITHTVVNNHEKDKRLPTEDFKYNTEQPEVKTQMKTKSLIDSVKRKSLENTVRLIENILINTVKNNEMAAKKLESSNHSKKPVQRLQSDLSATTNNNVVNQTYDQTQSDSDDSMKTESQTKDIQNSISDTSDNDITEQVKDPLQIKIEQEDNSSSDERDQKSQNELENIQCVDIDPSIVVKVEEISTWADIIESPFLKDMHSVKKDEVGDVDVIDAAFSFNAAMEAVKNGTYSNNYFECPHCSLLFNHPKRFLIHTKWHGFGLTNERRQVLQRERKMNRRKRKDEKALELMKEEEDDDKEKYPCKDCDREFLSKSSLKNHKYKFHPNPRYAKECNICNKMIQGQAAMQAHKLTHQGEVEFKCKECPKKFKYPHSLQKHMGVHREKIHQCPECPKAFGSVNLLKMHMKCHERASRGHTFRCTYCGKGFYEVYCLQVHERMHTGERPFTCNICSTSFATNSGLNRHLKVSHNSSKPFSCDTCHRSFVSEVIRDRHAIRAHGDPSLFQFVCKLCPCKYLTAKYLRKHVDKVHPKSKVKRKKQTDENDDDSEYDASTQV